MQDDEPTDVVLEQRALADEAMRPRDQRADGVRLAVASLLDMLGSCPHAELRMLRQGVLYAVDGMFTYSSGAPSCLLLRLHVVSLVFSVKTSRHSLLRPCRCCA
jgi:hypothetical protein